MRIVFGAGNEVSKPASLISGTTVGDVVADAGIKAVLGFGDNISISRDSVEVPMTAAVADTDVLVITTKASTKGVAKKGAKKGGKKGC